MNKFRRLTAWGWQRSDSVRLHLVLCALLGAASLWLRTGFPVIALGNAVDDDRLFVRAAHYLAAGEWLGPYDNLTLVKGMFYPLFLCAASLAAIPLKIAEQCVYLAVSALIAWIVARASQRRWLGSVMFAALAFNPSLWNPALARVIREGLYISLSPAVVALGIVVAFPPAGRGFARSVLLGCLLGLIGAGFWLTREEGIWLAPALASILVVAAAYAAWPRSAAPRSAGTALSPVSLLVAALVFGGCLQTVMRLNGEFYGVRILNEIKSKPFERAYGALARIKPQTWRRYIVFPADARQKAYAASPAARELAPVFEGALDRRWRGYGCDEMGIAPKDCPEILSGWFMWALRDAVAATGHYRSATDAQAYYTRLADEIDAACQTGALACLPRRIGLAPPFRWSYLGDAIDPALALTKILLTMRQGPIGSGSSVGAASDIYAFTDAVGPVSVRVNGGSMTGRRRALQMLAAQAIARGYALAMPVLAMLGACGIVVALARSRRRPAPAAMLALGIASLLAIGCRIALLAYLDATSLPAASLLYASPATPFVIVLAVVGIYLGAVALRRRDAEISSANPVRSAQ